MKNVFENIKNFVKTHKTVCITCLSVLVVGIVTALVVSFALKSKPEAEPTQEEILTEYLTEMGRDFYENYYYGGVGSSEESRKNFLQKYSEIGIKVSLDNFLIYESDNITKEFKEKVGQQAEGLNCSRENTKIIIYPQDPYGKTDYRIDTILKCGLEE